MELTIDPVTDKLNVLPLPDSGSQAQSSLPVVESPDQIEERNARIDQMMDSARRHLSEAADHIRKAERLQSRKPRRKRR